MPEPSGTEPARTSASTVCPWASPPIRAATRAGLDDIAAHVAVVDDVRFESPGQLDVIGARPEAVARLCVRAARPTAVRASS